MLASALLGFRGVASALEWDEGNQGPNTADELRTCNVFPFTTIDDNGGQMWQYRLGATGFTVPEGTVIYFVNSTGGSILVIHDSSPATDSHLPFWLIGEVDASIPDNAVGAFVREGLRWRQLWPF
jgi:hypothetical protein